MTTAALDFEELTLTEDQQNAQDKFLAFLTDTTQNVFVLSGSAGCGKSTLVRSLLDRLEKYRKTIKLINPKWADREVMLTATTNKAAEALHHLSGQETSTIHSALSLRVYTDFRANTTTLKVANGAQVVENKLLFIDEASFIDEQLLKMIFSRTYDCKIVFIGDPYQLSPVQSSGTPVFEKGYTGAHLTRVVRQAEGNPIIQLATMFRDTVKTGKFKSFKPDGFHIVRMDRNQFEDKIIEEFTRKDWGHNDSKILAWTNKCVISYNHAVRDLVKGDPNFKPGDYAICNSFVSSGRVSLKTDQTVLVHRIEDEVECLGVTGNWYTLENNGRFFQPKHLADKLEAIKHYRKTGNYSAVATIEQEWLDLRAAYACTVNKSQGSTYDKVFIDLDDIKRCHQYDQLARMLYVAVSRAKNHVYMTGDLV